MIWLKKNDFAMTERQKTINSLLAHPEQLLKKTPFTRGAEIGYQPSYPSLVEIAGKVNAQLPTYRKQVVTQEQFMNELDPNCHDVLFDDNIPSICVKVAKGDYRDIKYKRMALPIQRIIKNKQVMHLTANRTMFTLLDVEPTETNQRDFIVLKQYWNQRNQDGMRTKMVDTQLSFGEAGLLYYFNYKGEIKSRLISYADGYVICSHNDKNGDRLLESVYYINNSTEYIDSYDDTFMYRHIRRIDSDTLSDWVLINKIRHGFDEIPLVTKRGDVAWNNVQPIIESYEELYNVFNAIQKRFGWGIFYIKGKFKDDGKKIAGSVVLNDTSLDGKGDAKFLTPPTPEGMINTLDALMESIQLGSSTTFLLPKDVKISGDISGIAIMLTQSLDIENATLGVIEWQNVIDKMVRLFKFGLAKELVAKGINPTAITDFENLNVNAKFKVWRPLNEYEYNQMITMLTGAGVLSKESAIELNTLSKPDEKARVNKQEKENKEEITNNQTQEGEGTYPS